MTIEKLDLSGILGETALFKTPLFRIVLFKIKHKINEIIDWINNHEINILPRFKEELLKCLEDDEFRDRFLFGLSGNKFISISPGVEVPLEKELKPFPGAILAQSTSCVNTYRPVDANKTIENPSLAYKATAINRMQSESSEFPNLKLKEAEDELEKAIENLYSRPSEDGYYMVSKSTFECLQRKYIQWKEARNK